MPNQILRREYAGQMLGVPGRFFNVIGEIGASALESQTFRTAARPCESYGPGHEISAQIRFDDNCHNRHNSFAVTGDIVVGKNGRRREVAGGCLHEEIAKAFPELAPLIPWHLCSTDGPMHYVANTVYHAGDRDHNGLRQGEKRQIRYGKTGQLAWALVAINSEGVGISGTPAADEYRYGETVPLYLLKTSCDGETPRLATPRLEWRPLYRHGEGKARELAYARSSAIWPDATDADLCAEPDVLKAALLARLPALINNFRQDMLTAGLIWTDDNERARLIE